MNCLIAYVLLAPFAFMGSARRISTAHRWPGIPESQKDTICPDKVKLNRRDDCMDIETKNVVPSDCCNDLRWCNQELETMSEKYMAKMMAYFNQCELLETDAAFNSERKFQVMDNTRLCAPTCQNHAELRENNLPSYEPLELKCNGHEALNTLKERAVVISALHSAFSSCTTTSTTTTTLDYFDFTHFMNTARDYGRSHALFPSGSKYYCCCHPDTTQNAMSCVLKDTRTESHFERFRKIIWKTCQGAMGNSWRDWSNVHVPGTPDLQPELQGLHHIGDCVVPNEMLPEDLKNISHGELEKQLREFRQENKEYPEELEEKED